jgi:hypothetical protein
MADENRPDSYRLNWEFDPRRLPISVNQFMLQTGLPMAPDMSPSGEVFLTLGHAEPPRVLTDGEGGAQIIGLEGDSMPITVVGHFTLTRPRAEELQRILADWLNSLPGNYPAREDEA